MATTEADVTMSDEFAGFEEVDEGVLEQQRVRQSPNRDLLIKFAESGRKAIAKSVEEGKQPNTVAGTYRSALKTIKQADPNFPVDIRVRGQKVIIVNTELVGATEE